ncbi:MAG TPA: alpha/beta fold hydrolase [Actinomycetota bacterium]|nr:alpha/beta fold hydrolase [Actinomycetota bacterium]
MAFVHRPDGGRLYVEVHGQEDAEPLVLLEGLGGDVPGWRRNIPTLAAELRVVAFDFRGNGRSDPPPADPTMATFVDDTVAVLDHAGIPAAHLYGQSFGGMVAQELALDHPDRARSLILAATHPGHRHAVRSRARVPKGRPWEALYSEAFLRDHPDEVEEDLRSGTPQAEEAARRQWTAMRGFDAYDRLPTLRVPTLVLHGTEDRTIDPANARLLAERIPGAKLVLLEGAGHVYHAERPAEADRAVLDFVRRVGATDER